MIIEVRKGSSYAEDFSKQRCRKCRPANNQTEKYCASHESEKMKYLFSGNGEIFT